nr:hypothetical protein [Candidatus Cloacimonadota bacterium]
MKHFALFALLIILFGCSGEDSQYVDKTPPVRPKMIPHLGTPGDPDIYINDAWMEITDENNGIDTVPDGNKMRIMWEPFIDTDLSHLKIYRFSDIDPDPIEIDQIPANMHNYLDQGPLVERVWYSYFIELFDVAGNSAVSDTVSYALLAKPFLVGPEDGATVDIENLEFLWNRADDRTGFYRVLVWNHHRQLLWHGDLYLALEDDPLSMTFPILGDLDTPINPGDVLRWRVDYFDYDDLNQMNMGSKSEERIFIVSP